LLPNSAMSPLWEVPVPMARFITMPDWILAGQRIWWRSLLPLMGWWYRLGEMCLRMTRIIRSNPVMMWFISVMQGDGITGIVILIPLFRNLRLDKRLKLAKCWDYWARKAEAGDGPIYISKFLASNPQENGVHR